MSVKGTKELVHYLRMFHVLELLSYLQPLLL